jgi:hypothetical protein
MRTRRRPRRPDPREAWLRSRSRVFRLGPRLLRLLLLLGVWAACLDLDGADPAGPLHLVSDSAFGLSPSILRHTLAAAVPRLGLVSGCMDSTHDGGFVSWPHCGATPLGPLHPPMESGPRPDPISHPSAPSSLRDLPRAPGSVPDRFAVRTPPRELLAPPVFPLRGKPQRCSPPTGSLRSPSPLCGETRGLRFHPTPKNVPGGRCAQAPCHALCGASPHRRIPRLSPHSWKGRGSTSARG